MKFRAAAWSEAIQHQSNVANVDHGSTRFNFSFIVLTVASIATIPGVASFHHPAFLQRCEAWGSLRTSLHFDSPLGTVFCHPRLESMVVIFTIGKDCDQTGKVFRRDLPE